MPPRTNSARRRVSRRRRPQFEKLDERRVLAAYISEILFEPLFGNDQTDQYVEIRGTPQQALTNTYLLSIDGGSFNSGRVRTIFDLSSTTVGNNGYLVLTQAANRYLVDPAANEIESVSQGFRGLPNNMFEATSSFVNNIDAFLNASTFMLVESSVKPLIGDDIDTNDDGVIDRAGTAFGNWTVLDSVSSLRFSTSDHAYGRIVFADNTNYTSIPGATRVLIDSYGYVGRIGESTGYAVDDWVNGTTRDSNNASQNLVYRFDSGFFGQTTPRYLSDRLLDHLGAPNFFGGIRGSAFLDSNKDGIRDANELPLPGASFLVDTNGNGRHDVITTVVDPETFPAGTVLTSKIPGVTLTTTDAQLQSNDTIDVDATFAFQGLGTRTLSQGGIPWFNSTGRLRMDFANPVRSVSAEFANARVTVGYGYIEAFDRLGNSIGSFRTNAISTGERQVATLSFPDDRIAYAVAFGDNNFNTSSPFMSIEALQFSGGEPLAISDANGDFRVNYLYPGPYEVIATDSIYFQTTPTQSPVPADVIGTENYFFEFGFADNEPPQFVFEPVKFPEHSDVGRPLWTIKATDLNVSQKLTYRLLSVAGSAADPLDFALSIDPDTGVLSARRPAALDFEAGATMQITVEVSDGIAAPITGDFVITLEDINEAPVMPLTVFPLEELSPPNTVIGKVVATDVDAGPAV